MKLMHKFSKAIITPVLWAVFVLLGFLANSTPVEAIPTPVENDYAITQEISDLSNLDPLHNLIADVNDPNTATDATPSESTEEGMSCFDQIGPIGWLVCPTTGVLTKAIDGIYGFIEQFLVVEPLSTDHSSPIYIVWEYARNITNVVFVIFLLIIIYSHLTGLGLSNYNIKKTLPRIIVAAILVNLSFLICSLAVDISNILGGSLRNFFVGVEEMAINSGAIRAEAQISWADLFAGISGGAAILGLSVTAGLAIAGGPVALLLTLLPFVLGGLVSVVIGLATVSLRQAVVSILIMISPLAFVAYLLPNTEGLFKKWTKLLQQMLVFYPLFSMLYGASHLIGWVLISSAKSVFGVILGMAVQIFPLFFGITLLKMSNTLLGRVSNALGGLSQRPLGAIRGLAAERSALARAKYLGERPGRFDAARQLAQRLEDTRTRIREDTAKYTKITQERGQARAARGIYDRDGNLTRRGESLYGLERDSLRYQADITKQLTDFDEGLDAEAVARNRRQSERLAQTNTEIGKNLNRLKAEQGRALNVKFENLRSYEEGVNKAVSAHTKLEMGQTLNAEELESLQQYNEIRNVVASNNKARTDVKAQELVREGVSTIVANAIASKARVRTEITGDYFTLFNEASYTADINGFLKNSMTIDGRNENAMAAAFQVMMMRGDTDMIARALKEGTPTFADSTNLSELAMQKRVSDTLLQYKNDSAVLWGYAKCLNMARGKAEHARVTNDKILNDHTLSEAEKAAQYIEVNPDFFTFEDYLDPNGEAARFGLDVETMIASIADGAIASAQDRTVWGFAKDEDRLFFTTKQRRAGLFSQPQEGEKLDSLIDVHLGRDSTWNYIENGAKVSDKTKRKVLTFESRAALEKARQNIIDLVKDNNAVQMANFKTNSLTAFAATMSDDFTINADGKYVFDLRDDAQREKTLIDGLRNMQPHFRPNISHDMGQKAKRGQLDYMNPEIRRLLNEVLHFE